MAIDTLQVGGYEAGHRFRVDMNPISGLEDRGNNNQLPYMQPQREVPDMDRGSPGYHYWPVRWTTSGPPVPEVDARVISTDPAAAAMIDAYAVRLPDRSEKLSAQNTVDFLNVDDNCTRFTQSRSPPATVPKGESAATPKQRWRQQLHLETIKQDYSQPGAMSLISPSSAMTGVTDGSPNSVVTAEDEAAVAWPATPSTAQVRHSINTSMVTNPRPLCRNHMCVEIDNDHDDDLISPRSTLSIDLNVSMPGATEPARASTVAEEDYDMTPISDSGRSSGFLENMNTSSTNMADASMATKTSNQVRNVGETVPRTNKKRRQKSSSFDSHTHPKPQRDFHSSSTAEVSSRDSAQVSETRSEDASSGEDFAAACALLQLASDGERRREPNVPSMLVRSLPLELCGPHSGRERSDADDNWLLVDNSTSVLPRPGYKQRYKSVAALLAETPRLDALRVDQD